MPHLVHPTLPSGTLRALAQPDLRVDDRLTLRPWRAGDAPIARAAFDCPDIQRWHVRRLDSDDEARAWIAAWRTRWDAEVDAGWAVVDDCRVVGQAGLRTISLAEGSAQLSYWVLPDARGSGIAVRAAHAVTRWSFDVLGLHRVFLQHSTANEPSCRVAAKLGFALEGTLRGSLLHADGPHDAHSHAQLRTDRPQGPDDPASAFR